MPVRALPASAFLLYGALPATTAHLPVLPTVATYLPAATFLLAMTAAPFALLLRQRTCGAFVGGLRLPAPAAAATPAAPYRCNAPSLTRDRRRGVASRMCCMGVGTGERRMFSMA